MEATSLRQFIACVSNALARAGGGEDVEKEDDDDNDDDDSDHDSAAAREGDIVFSDLSEDEDTASDIFTLDEASDFTGKRLVPSSLPQWRGRARSPGRPPAASGTQSSTLPSWLKALRRSRCGPKFRYNWRCRIFKPPTALIGSAKTLLE